MGLAKGRTRHKLRPDDFAEMPTDGRKPLKYKDYGETGASTAAINHLVSNLRRRRTFTSSRSAKNSYGTDPSAVIDHVNSNGISLGRIRTSASSRSETNSSPPATSSSRQSLERQVKSVKNVAALHKEISKHLIKASKLDQEQAEWTSTLNAFVENNNCDSWAYSLRTPPVFRSRGTASRKQKLLDKTSEYPRASMSSGEDKPAIKYMDSTTESKTLKYADMRELFPKDVDPRPSTTDGRPAEIMKYSDIPHIKESGHRRSSSASNMADLTKPSDRGREPSPAPKGRQSTSDSRPRLSTSSVSSKTKRGESESQKRSNRTDSRTASQIRSQGGDSTGDKTILNSKQEQERSESRSHKRSSSMDSRRASQIRSQGGDSTGDSTILNSKQELERSESRSHKRSTSMDYKSAPRIRSQGGDSTNLNSKQELERSESKSHKRSSSMDYRSAAQIWSRIWSQGGDSSNLNSKQEPAKNNSSRTGPVRTRPGSSDGFNFDIMVEAPGSNNFSVDIMVEGAGPNNSQARSSSTDQWKKEAANFARTRTKQAGTNGNLKDEDGAAADFHNLSTKEGSTSRRFSQEGESDSKLGSRRKSIGSNKNLKEVHASHVSVTRHGSSRNLKPEGETNFANLYGRQDSAAGSSETNSWKKYASKRLYFRKNRATNASVELPLTKVAAASYNGGSLPFDEMVPFPNDIANLNKFLGDCKSEVEAGVPGRILTAVLGEDNSDLDSIVSTIAYAYFLSFKGNEELQYFVPVINMREEAFVLHTDAVWLFKVSGVDTKNFIFVDQISLLYYHRFRCLRLVLVDHSKLAPHQENNLQDAVIQIIDHDVPETLYPWVSNVEIEQVGSCCTLIAEKYVSEAAEHLAGRGISRLLLGAILLDTANLDGKFSRFTTRDEHMAAFLIHGAGRYGLQGFFRHLRKMKFDISVLSTKDVLRKDFKQWTLGPGKTDIHGCKGKRIHAAMSSLGVPLVEILSRKDIVKDLNRFGERMNLDLHLIVTGYYDIYDRYHREMLVVPKDIEHAEHMVTCFNEHKEGLKLSSSRFNGLPQEMLIYKQGQVTASRKVICEVLVDHFAQ